MDLDTAVRTLAPKLLGYCRLETYDPSLAEEIAQDTLTVLVRHWRTHGPPDSPAAFVFTVARRKAVRAMFRRRLWRPVEEARNFFDRGKSAEQAAIEADERLRVQRALAKLRRLDREILLMVTVGELGMEAAARALGVSLSAAKMRAMRARQRMREMLEEGHGHGQG